MEDKSVVTFDTLYLETVFINLLVFSILIRNVTMGNDGMFRPL